RGIDFHEQVASPGVARVPLQGLLQIRHALRDASPGAKPLGVIDVAHGFFRSQEQSATEMFLGLAILAKSSGSDSEIDLQVRIIRGELLRTAEELERTDKIALFHLAEAIVHETAAVARAL